MIAKAKSAGCWGAKFQLFTEKEAPDLPKHLYLDYHMAKELFNYGKEIGIEVFFTPMFEEAIDWCKDIGVNYYKIRFKDRHNGELNSYLRILTNKPIFRSCNYNSLFSSDQIIPFLCISNYPAEYIDYIEGLFHESTMRVFFKGISDHTPDCTLLSYIMTKQEEIEYFEKHVKLDNNCIEAKWSVTFEQLAEVLAL